MNKKLEAIAEQAADNLRRFIRESEEDVLKAWASATEEAELHETKPVLRLGFTISLDLEKDRMETALGFGVRYKLSAEDAIPDPDQPELPAMENGRRTRKGGGK